MNDRLSRTSPAKNFRKFSSTDLDSGGKIKFWRVKSYNFDKISSKLINMSKVCSFVHFSGHNWGNLEISSSHKLGCVVRMVVDSILPHAECGPNDHRKDAPPFSLGDILVGRSMSPWDEERLSNGLYLAELEVSFVVWIKKNPYPYPCLFSQIVLSI